MTIARYDLPLLSQTQTLRQVRFTCLVRLHSISFCMEVFMDVLARITKLRLNRGWTDYELAKRSGLPQSTISSWYTKNMMPSVSSLENICKGFGISLSQFFLEEDSGEATILSRQQHRLLAYASRLDPDQYESLLSFLERLNPTASLPSETEDDSSILPTL